MPRLREFHWILKISPEGFTSHPHSCQTCSETQCDGCQGECYWILLTFREIWADPKVVKISMTFIVCMCLCICARDSLVWMEMLMMMVPTLPVWWILDEDTQSCFFSFLCIRCVFVYFCQTLPSVKIGWEGWVALSPYMCVSVVSLYICVSVVSL